MNDTIGLKILPICTSAKCLSILRKNTSLSLAEIKNAILEERYVMEIPYTDDEGLEELIRCWKLLKEAGIPSQFYEYDQPTTADELLNLSGMYKEISDQIDDDIENE